MNELTLASVFDPAKRFRRSTDLVRDFEDASALDGYFLSDFGKDCFVRIAAGVTDRSTQRSWRLTGDYGSGKSSFALLLATSLSDHKRLPSRLQKDIVGAAPEVRRANYVPLLVLGAREPMSSAILRALLALHQKHFSRGATSKLEARLSKLSRSTSPIPEEEVVDLVQEITRKLVDQKKGTGLLLVLDEVGKFLEFAALYPERQDVFLLQRLGELASRSGDAPFLFVCLLHQGFNAYAESLATSAKREWEKIAGRLEEIQFRQPLDQIVMLIAAALNSDARRLPANQLSDLRQSMDLAIKLGWYGSAASRERLREQAAGLYPVDPLVIPILVRLFQRYSQNERSVFNFLFSYEPLGLQAFAATELKAARPYRLHHLFDYVRANLGQRLAVASYRSHWAVIESVIESYPAKDELELFTIKTIGVLNLLNSDDALPTEEAICWAVAGPNKIGHEQVKKVLRQLRQGKNVFLRGAQQGYCLWPHSSVDIEARYEDAKREIPIVASCAKEISRLLDTSPLVARRHYIETGNLRYLQVAYCSVSELEAKTREESTDADGTILVPLSENEREYKHVLEIAPAASRRRKSDFIRLIAVPKPLDRLAGTILDSLRWNWVVTHTPELNSDKYARDEVVRFQTDAANRLERAVQELVGLNRTNDRLHLQWFEEGEVTYLESGRALLSRISDLCFRTFPKAPRIHNELVNRRSISSAAAGARMRLIDRMFSSSGEPALGLPEKTNPPEKSMYLSVLRETGIHRPGANGKWTLGEPLTGDPCHARPAIEEIRAFLERNADERIGVAKLMEHLRRPPYGLRDGIIPLLLAAVTIADHRDIAVYENGTFLRDVGKDAFLRLSKNPERFDIQYCRIEPTRAELFQQLVALLSGDSKKPEETELLDLVRELCGIVANLPEYARQANRLSKRALAVRTAILDAKEPIRLVFHQLPEACGFSPFGPKAQVTRREARSFAHALKESIDEIQGLYTALETRIMRSLSQQFGYGEIGFAELRDALAERAEALAPKAADLKLRALCLRLQDTFLPLNQWIESVGSLLGLRPPSKWKDQDEDVFQRELVALAGQFLRTEAVCFSSDKSDADGRAIRIALTQTDGRERQQVLFVRRDDLQDLQRLKDEIQQLVAKHRQIGLAAASQALWDELKEIPE